MLLGACATEEPRPYTQDDASISADECDPQGIGSTERRIRYQTESVSVGAECVKQDQVRTCDAGGRWSTWSGDYAFEFCKVKGKASCGDMPHASVEVRSRYESMTVAHGSRCNREDQTRICENGTWSTWSGAFTFETCTVDGAASCGTSPHGTQEERYRYEAITVPFGSECKAPEKQTRDCDRGSWSDWTGTFTEENCRVLDAMSCGNTPHMGEETQTRWKADLVEGNEACESEVQTRTCSDGVLSGWSGTFTAVACEVKGKRSCGALPHAQIEKQELFESALVDFGKACLSIEQTRVCQDGTLPAWAPASAFAATTCRAKDPGVSGPPCEGGQVPCGDGSCCDPAAAIELPVEVLGAEGTMATLRFDLASDAAPLATSLWLQVNNLSYQNKASVRVNDGAWIDLNHGTVQMPEPERARGGMVHGGYSTIRLSLTVNNFRAGENKLSFRFNRSDGISMGFRVVRLQVRDANGGALLPDSHFFEVDPAKWKPPFADSASIAEGEALWRTAPLWSHYLGEGRTGNWYAATIPGRQQIRAVCADCHAQDGRDLEIFAYSNESIVLRSTFHGLSEEQGKKIASYIRSLSAKHPTVGRYGRPWNPPYQPGPAVAERPVHEWAAGAGLDAVLERDRDMLPAMFPEGVTADTVAAYFDSAAMEDHTTLPIAIQLPDWKHWLPLIHPKDAYAKNGYYDDPAVEFNPGRGYAEVRSFFEAKPVSQRSTSEIHSAINRHWRHYRLFLSQGSAKAEHWRTRDGSATTRGLVAAPSVPHMEMAATSLARLLAVKHFELMNEFGLQGLARERLDARDQPLERQWLGRDYQVFEIPAHFTACYDDVNRCQHFNGQPMQTGRFESTAWYHLQLVLNGGQGQMLHNSPVDNNYHPEFILVSNLSSGILEPLRYYSSINAMYQTRTWTGATSPNDGRGFRIRIQGPWYFLGKEGDARRQHLHGFAPGFYPAQLDTVTPGLTKWTLDALMSQFVREVERPENSLAIWQRFVPGRDPSNTLDPIDKASVVDVTISGPGTLENGGPLWADHTYWSIQQAAQLGVECAVLERTIAWASAAWPKIDFAALRANFTAYATLRQDADSMTAILGNAGEAPALQWTVNGMPVAEGGAQLSATQYAKGDTVAVQLTSSAACLAQARSSVTATRVAQ